MGSDKINNLLLIKDREDKRWINKWPLIILAVNRTDKVIGRIKFLTVSINTIKQLKKIGDPKGTKWLINLLNLFIILKIIKLNQIGKAKNIVKTKCLEDVKT